MRQSIQISLQESEINKHQSLFLGVFFSVKTLEKHPTSSLRRQQQI